MHLPTCHAKGTAGYIDCRWFATKNDGYSGGSQEQSNLNHCSRAGPKEYASEARTRKRPMDYFFLYRTLLISCIIGICILCNTSPVLGMTTGAFHTASSFRQQSYLYNSRSHIQSRINNFIKSSTHSHQHQTATSYRKSRVHSTTDESKEITASSHNINPALAPQTNNNNNSNNEYSFFDEATIYIRAGSGGQGASTYKKGVKNQNGPPDGGNGGKGGDVIFQLDTSLNTLAGLARYAWRPNSFGGGGGAKRRAASQGGDHVSGSNNRILTFRAENGADGERQRKQGRNGKDVIVRVPPGTVIREELLPSSSSPYSDVYELMDDIVNNDMIDLEEPLYKELGTVTHANPIMTIAYGGKGGEGSAINSQRGVHRPRISPQGGQRKRLQLTLKVVADVALVAVPNAGKSTLLAKVTRAKPKIADYPFTTVVPNLGVWIPNDNFELPEEEEQYDEDGNLASSNNKSLILCDVPGLIAGASDGIGLGHAFLRHVERCHVILHLLDATSETVLEEYAMINKELMRYGTGKLALMPQVVVVNKVDVAFGEDPQEMEKKKQQLETRLKEVMPHSRLMWISAKEAEGVDDLMERVALFVRKVKEVSAKEFT
eukprot:scaffold113786_cov47-Cyclotella_meneghiniana.AAC.2